MLTERRTDYPCSVDVYLCLKLSIYFLQEVVPDVFGCILDGRQLCTIACWQGDVCDIFEKKKLSEEKRVANLTKKTKHQMH